MKTSSFFIFENRYYRISSSFEFGLEPFHVQNSVFTHPDKSIKGYFHGKYSYRYPFLPMYYREGNKLWKVLSQKPWYWDYFPFLKKIGLV